MEPIPESVEAVEEFGPFRHEDLLTQLRPKARAVRDIVPDCVGLSVAALDEDITLTLVASDEEIAALDALQYLTGGPCVEGVKANRVLQYPEHDATDERAWQLFAQGTAAAAVASTLTLPILAEERVIGSVNLYAASANAFTGHHQDIARIFDAWAPGAVTNADLGFTTRRAAQDTTRELRETYRIEVAAGILAIREALDIDHARDRLHEAAHRAGVPTIRLAEMLIALARSHDSQ